MAIVQISRIQHRSGLAENLPQLAKAELGWAVDERKLYIGNGQLSDGAPETGNTEILTQYSDILTLANTYTYKNADAGYTPQTGNAKTQYNAIAWNGISQYVAVGNGGHIMHSIDGINWLNTDSGTTNNLKGIAYGAGVFVAVGGNGTVIYSSDGSSWLTSGAIAYTSVNGITYSSNDGLFAIVTLLGTIYTSNNGIDWTLQTSGVTVPLYTITYANDLYIAGGANGTILISSDAITWSNKSISEQTILSIQYINNAYIVTATGNKGFYSVDGIVWYRALIDSFVGITNDASRTYGITSWGDIYRSSGSTMSFLLPVTSGIEDFTAIYYANFVYMAITASGRIFTNTVDAGVASWYEQTSPVSTALNAVHYDGTQWVIVGDGGVVLTSSDAITFTEESTGITENLLSVTSVAGDTWIAVGADGAVITSPNGTDWFVRFSGVSQDLRGVAVADLGGGSYQAIAVGRDGVGVSSSGNSTTTGVTWTTTINSSAIDPSGSPITVPDLNAITYQTWIPPSASTPRNRWVIAGDRGYILTSSDGTNWYSKTTNTRADFQAINFANTYFFALGDVGLTYIISQDSDGWTPNTEKFGKNLQAPDITSISSNNTTHIMGGKYGYLYSANTQYKYWKSNTSNLNADIDSLIYASNKFIASGAQGLIAYSTDSINWTQQSYSYGATSTVRSIQNKLDDFVSVKDFGAKGDGVTDDTEAINRAFYELYCRSSSPTARKILYFPAGNYIVYGSINIPSHARIRGEGNYNTIITQTINPYVYPYITWVMQTADDKQQTGTLIGLNGAGMPTDIVIEDIAINSLGDGLLLNSTTKINLENVRFIGPFSNTNVTSSVDTISGNSVSGIKISGYNLVPPNDVNFNNCLFDGFNYGIHLVSGQYLTNTLINSCTFNNLFIGILLEGENSINVTVSNSIMDKIYDEGIKASYSRNILSFANYYKDVGNHLGGYAAPITNVIYYDDTCFGCASIGDQFDRTNQYNLTFHRVYESPNNIDWNYSDGLRLGSLQQMNGKAISLESGITNELVTEFDEYNSTAIGLEMLYTISRNNAVRSGTLKVIFLNNTAYLDDDSSQNGDVGVTFGYNGTDLTYTTDSNGTGTLNYAIRYLEMLAPVV